VVARDGGVTITVLVDTTSVEVFAGFGECVITDQVFPDPASRGVAVFAEEGTGILVELSITRLDGLQQGSMSPAQGGSPASGLGHLSQGT
jgi:fructan beta-fructosidase